MSHGSRTLHCHAVLLLGLTGCTTVGPRPVHPEIVRLDGTKITPAVLTERIEELTHAAQVQGLTVAIFNDAEKVYSRSFGFANLPVGQPLQLNTEFYGASLSKAVFAVLVMKLVEQGVIGLDTPLQEYLDELLWKNKGQGSPDTPRAKERICSPFRRPVQRSLSLYR